jgi:hypothetical protein
MRNDAQSFNTEPRGHRSKRASAVCRHNQATGHRLRARREPHRRAEADFRTTTIGHGTGFCGLLWAGLAADRSVDQPRVREGINLGTGGQVPRLCPQDLRLRNQEGSR